MFRLIVALSVVCLALETVVLAQDTNVGFVVTVSINQYPYQVSVQLYSGHICGASVLSNKYCLTAASCLIDAIDQGLVDDLSIRAGSSTWSSGGVPRKVRQAIVHPQYSRQSMAYDVGLIRLASPLIYGPTISPVRLPNQQMAQSGASVVNSGWGKLNQANEQISTELQAVTFKYLTKSDCGSYGIYGSSIIDSMICAVGPGTDTCHGDIGGPLVEEGSSLQLGVLLFGIGCSSEGAPNVYGDLSNPTVLAFLKRYVNPLP